MNGLLTEREWRKQASRQSRRRPEWVGAQFVLPVQNLRGLRQDRSFHAFLLLLSITIAVLLPCFVPIRTQEVIADVPEAAIHAPSEPRRVSSIQYGLPREIAYKEHTFTQEQLMRGRMLLLDADHPLPPEAPPPNTFSIASYGRGMVPVQSLTLQSGRETIDALCGLFNALRAQDLTGLTVSQGTQSREQMKKKRRTIMRDEMRSHSPNEAKQLADAACERMIHEELLQEHTVELRFNRSHSGTADEHKLLQTAWRYGFIRTKESFFRYVGRAHATAMTYLDLDLPSYLEWLHKKEALAIYQDGALQYLILCKPAQGTHTAFNLPVNAQCEVSADNTGYAVAACTF